MSPGEADDAAVDEVGDHEADFVVVAGETGDRADDIGERELAFDVAFHVVLDPVNCFESFGRATLKLVWAVAATR